MYKCLALAACITAAIVIPRFTARRVPYNAVTRTRQDVIAVSAALETFKSDNGRFPMSSEGLAALSVAPPRCPSWDGAYVAKAVVADLWGHPFIYRVPGIHNPQSFDVSSAGPDGKAGTSDDIGNWILN